jgi:hypothetical protein
MWWLIYGVMGREREDFKESAGILVQGVTPFVY